MSLVRCPRCLWPKPSSNFQRVEIGRGRHDSWCRHCANIRGEMSLYSEPPKMPHIEAPSQEALTAIRRARREREAWRQRGAPVVERPYLRYPSGDLVVFGMGGLTPS